MLLLVSVVVERAEPKYPTQNRYYYSRETIRLPKSSPGPPLPKEPHQGCDRNLIKRFNLEVNLIKVSI
jgi:hypothetical protein